MSLRDRKAQASETSKATKKIGLVAQLIVEAGIAPFGRGVTNSVKADCFRPYGDRTEEETRQLVEDAVKVVVAEKARSGVDIRPQLGPVLNVRVVPDTSLTPTSRWQGNMYSMKDYDANDRFTHKRHSDFILDFMSDEINDLEGKPFWGHVTWKNLPAGDQYGGDYTQINADNSDELSIIITHLPNKRAATDLVKALREGTTKTDDLCVARGYDVAGIRQAIGQALGSSKAATAADKAPTLTAIGAKTTVSYMTLEGFTKDSTINFLNENMPGVDNDIDALAEKVLADPGDIAIVLNKPEYFRAKMEATGLNDQDALVKVTEDTGLANVADLAAFLQITEASF